MSPITAVLLACLVAAATAVVPATHHEEDSSELIHKHHPQVTSLAHGVHQLHYKNELGHDSCLTCEPMTSDPKDPAHKCGCADVAAIQCQIKSMRHQVDQIHAIASQLAKH